MEKLSARPRALPVAPLVLLVLAAIGAVVAAMTLKDGYLRMLVEVLGFYAMAQVWNLLAGYAGLLSFGHGAFIGLGAYAIYLLSNTFGVHPYAAILVAPVAGILLAIIVAPALFRLREVYFTIASWVVADVVTLIVANSAIFNYQIGLNLRALRSLDRHTFVPTMFLVMAAIAIGLTLLVFLLMRSRIGLALMAVRDNEEAASSLGVNVWKAQFIAFLISAAGVALAAAPYFVLRSQITPATAFDMNFLVIVFFIAVIGGLGTIEGPIIGTLIYYVLREFFEDAGNWYLILTGVVAVVTMVVAPQGIAGYLRNKFGFVLFDVRRLPPR